MNETLQNIMLFINNHTLLLIGICVFLILVLVGYLIDNSVKSKRVRKDIKNPDQVPENIKDEIIKQAEEKAIIKENETKNENVTIGEENIFQNNTENNTVNFENFATQENNVENAPLETNVFDSLNTTEESSLNLNLNPTNKKEENVQIDPDANIMLFNENKEEFKNDKSLSEILSNVEKETQLVNDSNIFTDNSNNIVINENVAKNDVQIENNNSQDELDRIMRKLSTMSNNVNDDNYTNIF